MKKGVLELRPIYVRKEERTKVHVFVVMLTHIIIKEIKRLWAKVEIDIKEAIEELSIPPLM